MGGPPRNMKISSLAILLLLASAATASSGNASPPNIVFILADDLGWNDVGLHNPNILTPNIDQLAKEGIFLDQNYVQPVCTPSRAALMTGVYPFRLGLQHNAILPQQNACLPLDRTVLPQVLQQKGYKSHIVGKWHLGFCNWNCTPTYRGFDSFFGFYQGQTDYYNKTIMKYYDFRDGVEVDRSVVGNYSTPQYAERIERIINDHDKSSPLFMYLPFQNCHTPLEVSRKYYNMYPHIKDKDRRTFAGMVTAMDDAIGQTVQALKDSGQYDNTLIIFSTDNGGWPQHGGNNYPLRGGKITIFEGGTRAISFVHGPMFKTKGAKYQGLMHVVDWLPTIAEAAGITDLPEDIDGVSQWQALLNLSLPSPRKEIIYNIDNSTFPMQGKEAIRIGDYKLIAGFPGLYPSWYKPPEDGHHKTSHDITFDNSNILVQDGETPHFNHTASGQLLKKNKKAFEYKFLFDLAQDPNERENIYLLKPEIAKQLEERLDFHKKRMIAPNYPGADPDSDPEQYGGAWSPGWC